MLGLASDVINGELVPVIRREAYAPTAWGPTPGQAGGFAPVPTVPPAVSAQNYGAMGSQAPGFDAGIGSGGGNLAAASAAGAMPFHFKLSPLPWAILFLVIGLVGLRLVHWR